MKNSRKLDQFMIEKLHDMVDKIHERFNKNAFVHQVIRANDLNVEYAFHLFKDKSIPVEIFVGSSHCFNVPRNLGEKYFQLSIYVDKIQHVKQKFMVEYDEEDDDDTVKNAINLASNQLLQWVDKNL